MIYPSTALNTEEKRESIKMRELSVVMYHYVRDLENSRYPRIKGLDFSFFRQQVQFLKENFSIITMEELIASYEEAYELPEKAVLLTFDDGYKDHYLNVYPILKEYGIQGSFFIPGKTFYESVLLDVNKIHFILASMSIRELVTRLMMQLDFYRGQEYPYEANEVLYEKYAVASRFDSADTIFVKRILQTVLPEELRSVIASNLFEQAVGIEESKFAKELYMNYDQIKCMKLDGMHIGLHGYDHYWLGNLDQKKMEQDVRRSKEVLGDFLDARKWTIAYPYGSYNEAVLECMQTAGCAAGFTTEVRKASIPGGSRYTIPRLDTNDFPPKSHNFEKIQ